jgi:hypothetical protein
VFYPGDYKLAITNEECKPFTTDLTIVDKNNRGDLINKDFNLTALKSFEPVEDKTKKTTPTQDKGVKKPIVQPKKN